MRNERARPQQCWKSCAKGYNIVALRLSDHGTKEMLGFVGWKVWLVSNFAQQHAKTSNNMQQGVQTDATCNIQQCWELLANNVASVCTGLNDLNNDLFKFKYLDTRRSPSSWICNFSTPPVWFEWSALWLVGSKCCKQWCYGLGFLEIPELWSKERKSSNLTLYIQECPTSIFSQQYRKKKNQEKR